MVSILKKRHQKILLNSDAHSPYEVGNFKDVISKFKELGISRKDILNEKEALKILGIS